MTAATTAPIMDHDRRDPYGLVGNRMHTTSAAEALQLADLDWEVKLFPAAAIIDGLPISIPQRYATVRVNPDTTVKPITTVSTRYMPWQNRQTVDLMQQVVDSSDAVFVAGGHTHGGGRTFMQMALPKGISVGGRDPLDVSMVLFNSHDTSGALTLVPTVKRIYCTNQFPALRSSKVRFSAKHTKGALDVGLDQIRRAIQLTFDTATEVEKIGNVLVQRPMSPVMFESFVKQVHTPEVDDRGVETTGSRVWREKLVISFKDAVNLDPIRNTEWAALQTIIEGQDWLGRARNPLTHAKRQVDRPATAEGIKTKALELLMA